MCINWFGDLGLEFSYRGYGTESVEQYALGKSGVPILASVSLSTNGTRGVGNLDCSCGTRRYEMIPLITIKCDNGQRQSF